MQRAVTAVCVWFSLENPQTHTEGLAVKVRGRGHPSLLPSLPASSPLCTRLHPLQLFSLQLVCVRVSRFYSPHMPHACVSRACFMHAFFTPLFIYPVITIGSHLMFFAGMSVCPRASALVELQRSLGCPCKCQNVGTVEDSSLFELLRTFFFLFLRVSAIRRQAFEFTGAAREGGQKGENWTDEGSKDL